MSAPLRLHVETDPAQPDGLRATPEAVTAALAALPGLAERVSCSFGEAGAVPPDTAVLFTTRKLDLARQRALAPGLRWVQVVSAGVEAYLRGLPADLVLCNASGVHAEKGAEFILAGLLMLNLGIPGFVDDRAARRWQPSYGGPLRGRRVTLLGVGAIGAAAAARMAGFGLHVTGVTRSGRAEAPLDRCLPVSALDTVLGETDMLVSTLPLTAETAGLVSAARLRALPRGAGIVSCGRAQVFDNAAMLALLEEGHLGGAVLDVFPEEPLPPDSPFWAAPRTIVTPHCSLDDHTDYVGQCLAILAENLRRDLAGRPLRNVVDPARGY